MSSVRGLSRPTGEQINDFLIPTQVKTLNEGLGESKDGLTQIQNGLSEAGKQLSENTPKLNEAAAGAKELTKGTADLKDGITELGQGLSAIQKESRAAAQAQANSKQGLPSAKARRS